MSPYCHYDAIDQVIDVLYCATPPMPEEVILDCQNNNKRSNHPIASCRKLELVFSRRPLLNIGLVGESAGWRCYCSHDRHSSD